MAAGCCKRPSSNQRRRCNKPSRRTSRLQALAVGKKNDSFWPRAARAVQNGSTWLAEADRRMPKTIGRSLMRQAVLLIEEGDDLEGSLGDHLGKSVSGERHWRETGLEFGERLAITIHSVGGHTYAPHGSGGLGLVIKNVEFTMKVALEGPWFVGRLKIEGRGQILRSTSQWCAHAVAA